MAAPRTLSEARMMLRAKLQPLTPPTIPQARSLCRAQYSTSPRSITQAQRTRLRPLLRSTRFAQFLRPIRNRRLNSSNAPQRPNPHPTPHLNSPEPAPSLSARLKQMSKEYGWTALGVYLALSALDFPFCFLAVRLLGTDRIGHWEHVVVEAISDVIRTVYPGFRQKAKLAVESEMAATEREGELEGMTGVVATGDQASIWTQLALAYAVHKSLIFIRVPITAAILPKVVKTLRGWGWNIGKKAAKPT